MPTIEMKRMETMSADEREIRDAIARFGHSLETRDLDALMAGYADDVVLFDLQPPWRIVGKDAIRRIWAESFANCFPKEFHSVHRDVSVHVSGDLAVAFGLHGFHSDTEPQHPACQAWLRFTVTYRKVDGRWLGTHDHVSMPFDFEKNQLAPIVDVD